MKLELNISDVLYNKLRIECVINKKNMNEIVFERIIFKPFDEETEKYFSEIIVEEFNKEFNK